MRKLLLITLVFTGLAVVLLPGISLAADPPPGGIPTAMPDPGKALEPDIEAEITSAFEARTTAAGENILAYLVFDTEIERMRVAEDQTQAVLFIQSLDPETGEVIPAEPGLGIAQLTPNGWVVILQSDPQWGDLLQTLPESLLSADAKEHWFDLYRLACDTSSIGPLTGYFLPWDGGTHRYLTRSIYHTVGPGENPSQSMLYAFDFSTSPSQKFDLYAAKAGRVKWVRISQPDGDASSPGNYIVLEDPTTTPTTYQLYLHLAQNSVPLELRTAGAQVFQGDFIGVADDTGYSTNHHLHFQVHDDPSSYWGCSIDIRFDDVAINGGRPRTPSEAANFPQYGSQGAYTYVSGNKPQSDIAAPLGGMFKPVQGYLAGAAVDLSGWALDAESGLAQVYFMTNISGSWVQLGPASTDVLLDYSWDLCADNIPDGPVSVGIFAMDTRGNQAGPLNIRTFAKDHACASPPPACIPAAGEVALYAGPNYTGDCSVFSAGAYIYPSTSRVGEAVGSIMTGQDAVVTLYTELTFQGRSETFGVNDPNVADNWPADENISLIYVQGAGNVPTAPLPAWPENNAVFPAETSLSLVWDDGGGTGEFQARLTGPSGEVLGEWGPDPVWNLGSLEPGAYTWDVRARNDAGTTGWGPSAAFTVSTLPVPTGAVPEAVPYAEGFETAPSGWTATGLWQQLNESDAAHGGSYAFWYGTGSFDSGTYDTGGTNHGDLTSPEIAVPASGEYFLRFWSWYQTEGPGTRWDQRWLQISVDSGPFTNVYQMADDPAGYWMQSPYLSLAPYAGQNIRVRFHFETLDGRDNSSLGWLVDDVSISTAAPPACPDVNEPNDGPESATPAGNGVFSGEICPAGDQDWFVFPAEAGDDLLVDVDARADGSALDPYAFLLDEATLSIVAENDDEVLYTLLDPLMRAVIPESGNYYLKLKAWNHPAVGGVPYTYTVSIAVDGDEPLISFFGPTEVITDENNVPALVTLQADVTDTGSGVERVEFWYHSADWLNGDWLLLGTDTDGADGWTVGWNTLSLPAERDMALLVIAYDANGHTAVQGVWDLFAFRNKMYLPVTIRE